MIGACPWGARLFGRSEWRLGDVAGVTADTLVAEMGRRTSSCVLTVLGTVCLPTRKHRPLDTFWERSGKMEARYFRDEVNRISK